MTDAAFDVFVSVAGQDSPRWRILPGEDTAEFSASRLRLSWRQRIHFLRHGGLDVLVRRASKETPA